MKSLSSVTLLGLLDPEDGSTMFLRNFGKATSLHDVTSRNARIYSNTSVSIAAACIAQSSHTFCLYLPHSTDIESISKLEMYCFLPDVYI